MSAPLKLCPWCGKSLADHESVGVPGINAGMWVCEHAPHDHLAAAGPITAWPLGGGKWQVRS